METRASRPTRTKVAVLGGGLGGLAAAYRLTDPALKNRFEVTVYQQGWRLGGKCASGRDRHHGQRIEEHGLHLFLGWYDQAFGLVREVYDQWRAPAGSPIATVDQAFVPQRSVVLCEQQPGRRGRWAWWNVPFPKLPGIPGAPRDESDVHPTVLLRRLVGALADPADTLGVTLPPGSSPSRWLGHDRAHQLAVSATAPGRLEGAHADDAAANAELARLLTDVRAEVHRLHGANLADVRASVREAWLLLQLGVACGLGLLADVVPYGDDGWERIDHLDLKDWLHQHGAAHPDVTFCAPIRLFYDLAFAYLDGDTSSPATAQLAAGTALKTLLRTGFGYRDAPVWRMTAGMGDVVITPLYEVLVDRGVRFEFFHRVDKLRLTDDGTRVATIDVSRQADLVDDTYQPLIRVETGAPGAAGGAAGGPIDAWPSEPLWEQLTDGDRLAGAHVNFESAWCDEVVGTRRLEIGRDFDEVVLAIPVGGLQQIAAEVAEAHPRWRAMLDGMPTVETQSVQLWTTTDLAGLGWQEGPMVGSGYAEPFDSFADMSQVLANECWTSTDSAAAAEVANGGEAASGGESGGGGATEPCAAPASVQYLVSPLRSTSADPLADPDYPARQLATVRANAVEWLTRDANTIYPGLSDGSKVAWELLHDPADGTGEARLDAQYLRANVDPSERYVLTPPGTTHLRLDPADADLANLAPAGDWVRTSINGGSAEAAVEGGFAAAAAIIARS